MNTIKIYTDGACKGNPGPGGYAAVILYEGVKKEVTGADPYTTNNRMELMGVIAGLEYVSNSYNCDKVDIYSDSAYIVNAFNNNWISKWKRNGWKTSTGDVKNLDLWKRLLEQCEKYKVEFHKVKGHSNNQMNNLCDKLAVESRKNIEKLSL